MERDEAQQFEQPFKLVTERVKPYRDKLSGQMHESRYWLFWDKREKFYQRIGLLDKVLVSSIVTKYLTFSFFPVGWVYSHQLKVFAFTGSEFFSVLQSSFHDVWARSFSSSLGETMRYSTSAAFDTFPWPNELVQLGGIGSAVHDCRARLMAQQREGFTTIYNRFHDPDEASGDIQKLRKLHVEMDNAVAAAYGWSDLDLGHGFHETKQGVRYTICEPARRDVLARLLKLNHERYAEEVKQGLHEKKKPNETKGNKKAEAADTGRTLYGEDDA